MEIILQHLKVDQINSGVVFDSNFSLRSLLDFIIPKAYAKLAFKRRNSSSFSDPYTLKVLFSRIVRSMLELASILWFPFYEMHKYSIKRVQKSITKFALRSLNFENGFPPYNSRCLLVDLKTLKVRRNILSLLFLHDILSNAIDSLPDSN